MFSMGPKIQYEEAGVTWHGNLVLRNRLRLHSSYGYLLYLPGRSDSGFDGAAVIYPEDENEEVFLRDKLSSDLLWVAPTKVDIIEGSFANASDCTCDVKALFMYGHEAGCEYARKRQ